MEQSSWSVILITSLEFHLSMKIYTGFMLMMELNARFLFSYSLSNLWMISLDINQLNSPSSIFIMQMNYFLLKFYTALIPMAIAPSISVAAPELWDSLYILKSF